VRPLHGQQTVLGCALCLLAGCADGSDRSRGEPEIRFVDGTAAAGIGFERDHGRYGDFYYVEFMTGGALFFDADGDLDPDLYLLNGTRLGGEPLEPAPRSALYLNDGRGSFHDATEGSGLGDARYGEGACSGDYDNDGDADLFVSFFAAPNALFRNDGNGRFTDVAAEAGVTGIDCFSASSAFADVDNDGWLDLYVANCLATTLADNPVCEWPARDGSGKVRRYCVPERYAPLDDQLYRNRGDGTFEDVTRASGLDREGRSLGVAFADFDDDGDQDLFVACDRSANLYYENRGGGRFEERGWKAGVALGEEGSAMAGMGIATGDLDGDGRLDAVLTYFENERNAFYRNLGGHRFENLAAQNGTGPACYDLIGWGVELFDADLDRDLDVLLVNGHVIDNVERFREPVAGYAQPRLFYQNDGAGRFESLGARAGPAFEAERVSRGACLADVDQDGDLDALVANLFGRPDLLINETPRGKRHWLEIKLVGTLSNRDGIGARVLAHLPGRVLQREVHSGQSYLSQSDLTVHFGLGEARVVPKLEVRWPSGTRSVLANVPADQLLRIVEPNT
jgi:hypothetical protein